MGFEVDGWRSVERAAGSGNIRPRPLPYGRGSDWAMCLFNRACARGAVHVHEKEGAGLHARRGDFVVLLGAAGGQDARAPRMANHSICKGVYLGDSLP